MAAEILTIPCLSDNYCFLIRCPDTGVVALIDAPESAPVLAVLADLGLSLDMVILTHHHWDHVDGLAELRDAFDPVIVGSKLDADRLPVLDIEVVEGDMVEIGNLRGEVIDVSGHTINDLAFHFADQDNPAVFTADSLMALGCGRVFEGTMPMMWQSLSKLAALPPETVVYSGHEYTEANARFALTIEPDNQDLLDRVADITEKRSNGQPTVPSLLELELATNPFLRAGSAERFAEIRAAKDKF